MYTYKELDNDFLEEAKRIEDEAIQIINSKGGNRKRGFFQKMGREMGSFSAAIKLINKNAEKDTTYGYNMLKRYGVLHLSLEQQFLDYYNNSDYFRLLCEVHGTELINRTAANAKNFLRQ